MTVTVDGPGKIRTIVGDTSHLFESDYAYYLLIQLTGSVVQAVKWAHIGLVNLIAPNNVWVTEVRPVVTERNSLIRCPAGKSMNQNYRVVVGPFIYGQVVIAAVFVTVLVQAEQSCFLPFVGISDKLVAELEDECEHTDIEILVNKLLPRHVFAFSHGGE